MDLEKLQKREGLPAEHDFLGKAEGLLEAEGIAASVLKPVASVALELAASAAWKHPASSAGLELVVSAVDKLAAPADLELAAPAEPLLGLEEKEK